MCEHAYLSAMVGFVREHVAQHFRADGPRRRPPVSAKNFNATAGLAECFREHLFAAGSTLGQSSTRFFRGAVDAIQQCWRLQVRGRQPDHFERTLCMWVKIAAMVRALPGGFALQAAGSRFSIRAWFIRSFAAKICTAAWPIAA